MRSAINAWAPAVRLSSGLSDTVIVDSRRQTPLPVWAVDAGALGRDRARMC
jgi:hypothetical protein